MIEKRAHHEEAISPVVGVMLMLVVTIVIAGLIAVFASGSVGSTASTPVTIFTVKDIKTITIPGTPDSTYIDYVEFAHKGGDTLSLDGIRVEFTCYGTVTSVPTLYLESSSKNSGLSTGDTLRVKSYDSGNTVQVGLKSAEGVPVSYKIIDTASNNAIASGNFVVT